MTTIFLRGNNTFRPRPWQRYVFDILEDSLPLADVERIQVVQGKIVEGKTCYLVNQTTKVETDYAGFRALIPVVPGDILIIEPLVNRR